MGNTSSLEDRHGAPGSLQQRSVIPDLINLSSEEGEDDDLSDGQSPVTSPQKRRKGNKLSINHWKFRLRAVDEENEECPVCATTFEKDCVVALLPCGHYFCKSCISKWVRRKHQYTCPICRHNLKASSKEKNANVEVSASHGSDTDQSDHNTTYLSSPRLFDDDYNHFHKLNLRNGGKFETLDRNFDLIMSKMLQAYTQENPKDQEQAI